MGEGATVTRKALELIENSFPALVLRIYHTISSSWRAGCHEKGPGRGFEDFAARPRYHDRAQDQSWRRRPPGRY
jgi:hypothetical protein